MKFQSLYTNTGSIRSIAGLLVVTVLVSYATMHADEIVNGTVRFCKDGVDQAKSLLHKGKKQYSVIERHYDGTLHDTGKRIWR